MTVNTLSYSGDQGRYGASQVNYVTKSGSNQFHGNVYELWNGSKFSAANYFTNATPAYFALMGMSANRGAAPPAK